MATKSTQASVEEDSVTKDGLQITFTNGSLEQLKELGAFFNKSNPTEVIEQAIGLLQHIKESTDDSSGRLSFGVLP